jgi:hypothetical protein
VSAVRILSRPWFEFLSYVLVALGAVLPALLSGGVVGDGVDMYGTFWFYWWVQHCIQTLSDPGFTDLMFHPMGKDIFAHTGNNFIDALAAQPLMVALGFPRYQPWFVAVLLLGNALSFRVLAKHLFTHKAAVWASSLLWMVNPFVMFECICGRLTQALLWFLPLAIYHFLKAGRGGWRNPVLAGIFTALQAWTYWFLGWFMVIAFAWLGAVQLASAPRRWRGLVRGWVIAGAVCLACIAPALFAMSAVAEAGEIPGLIGGGSIFEAPERVGNNVAAQLLGLLTLESKGHPLLGNLVWGGGLLLCLWIRKSRWMWGGLAVLILGFAVGPVLGGEDGTVLPHYMVLYRHLPFFSRLWFPYRMASIALLAVAVGIGFAVQQVAASEGPWRRWVWGLPLLLTATTLLEQSRVDAYPMLHRALEVPQIYRQIGRRGGAIIELPIGLARETIIWQTVHHQPTLGGMGENAMVFWPDGFKQRLMSPFLRFTRYIVRNPMRRIVYRPEDIDALTDEGFRWLVMDRKLVDSQELGRARAKGRLPREDLSLEVTAAMVDVIGAPVAVEGQYVVWDLLGGEVWSAPLTPTETSLRSRIWDREAPLERETRGGDKETR